MTTGTSATHPPGSSATRQGYALRRRTPRGAFVEERLTELRYRPAPDFVEVTLTWGASVVQPTFPAEVVFAPARFGVALRDIDYYLDTNPDPAAWRKTIARHWRATTIDTTTSG